MLDRLPVVTVAATVLAGYLVLALPLAGALGRHALADRLRGDTGRRGTLYRQLIRHQWLLAAAALGIVGLGGLTPSALGLRFTARSAHAVGGAPATLLLVAAGSALMLLPVPSAAAALLPTTGAERRLYVWVAVTAGIVEELLFRGFLMLYLTSVAGWSWQCAALGSALAFGLGHLYQGLGAALTVTIAGFVLAALYEQTASLLLPVLIHTAVDLRGLGTRKPAPRNATAPAAAPAGPHRETRAER